MPTARCAPLSCWPGTPQRRVTTPRMSRTHSTRRSPTRRCRYVWTGLSTWMQIIRYWVLICLRLMAGQLWMMLRTG
jgi:hypothetical protein